MTQSGLAVVSMARSGLVVVSMAQSGLAIVRMAQSGLVSDSWLSKGVDCSAKSDEEVPQSHRLAGRKWCLTGNLSKGSQKDSHGQIG